MCLQNRRDGKIIKTVPTVNSVNCGDLFQRLSVHRKQVQFMMLQCIDTLILFIICRQSWA